MRTRVDRAADFPADGDGIRPGAPRRGRASCSSQARTKSRGGQPIHRARRLGPQGEAGDDAMLGLVLAALNPVLKPLYDAFYRVFLMVLSTEHIEYLDYTRQHIAF